MKIVVPVMPRSLEEAQEIDLSKFDSVDIIEWRADALPKDDIINVAPAIFEKFAGHEIIFTLRTTREGGNIVLSDAEYVELIRKLILSTIQIILILSIFHIKKFFKKC